MRNGGLQISNFRSEISRPARSRASIPGLRSAAAAGMLGRMLTKRIIPCLDVTGGRVVKGTKFLQLRDAGDPVECAKAYDAQGADELVFLDITASSDNRATMVDVVGRTASECFMPLTVGGGIRAVEDMRLMLHAGADKVSVNTSAIQRPELIREGAGRFGSQCIVVAIDARRRPEGGWSVFTHGGRHPTDLEAVLHQHPSVHEAAVVGVPSLAWGETPIAFVTLWPDKKIAAEDLRAWANGHLGKTQRLTKIEIVDVLPRSSIGKVLKRELRDGFKGQVD